jgi:hypothetical protein
VPYWGLSHGCRHKMVLNTDCKNSTTKDRLIFSTGDYINIGDLEHFGRIDLIFLLDNFDDNHIFVVVRPLQRSATFDDVLSLEILRESNEGPIIVGIPAVQPTKLYMVPINDGVVWVDRDLHTL